MHRLYANENYPLNGVERLRVLGHDVLTAQEAGNAGQRIPDEEVLRYAKEHGRAVVTLNRRDFVMLHEASDDHLGIIVCTQDLDFEAQAGRIHDSIAGIVDLARQLIKVNRPP